MTNLKKEFEILQNAYQKLGQERDKQILQINQLEAVKGAAQDLYDNRLGWIDDRNPYAHHEFWERLQKALGGK